MLPPDASLDKILERQCETLRNLETATVFIKNRHEMKDEFVKMYTAVTQISDGVEAQRQKLSNMKEEIKKMKDLILKLNDLDRKIIHMEKNVPLKLIYDYHVIESSAVKAAPKKEDPVATPVMQDCKKTLFNEPEVYPTMPLITQEEFSQIPKYIIGRQSLNTINSLINTINEIIQKKYTFLSMGKAHARSRGNLNLFLQYKRQEMDMANENGSLYFFTGEDYEEHTSTKLNKSKLNLLIVLRHCKRIREWRMKNDTRYILCKT